MGKRIIGLDLDIKYTQISFYNEKTGEPETVNAPENKDRCLIPTPPDLFPLIGDSVELGVMTLANFLKKCIGLIRPAASPEDTVIAVTMREMTGGWADALRDACEMLGIPGTSVYLETHRESFCYYTLSQKKELWNQKAALFEYEEEQIFSWTMETDYSTKPALVSADPGKELHLERRGAESDGQWNERRDQAFLALIRELFEGERYSAVFLVGESFDKTWAVESLRFLCQRRHVFQGRNLYTKGACYGAMNRQGLGRHIGNYLYWSEDTVKTNLSMRMENRGKTTGYLLASAGVNWFEAGHTCEFLTDGTKEVLIYGRPILGDGTVQSYSIPLKGLPDRPPKTTRLSLAVSFLSAAQCRVTIRDLGLGEFYPASGLSWESVLEV